MQLASYDNTIRVILADDHSIFRHIFEAFLRKTGGFEIVGQASDGNELIQLVERENPDIVITDLKMPNLNGIEATKILKSRFPQVGIIAFTLYSDDYFILAMLQAGADGYLLKSMLESEVIDAIKTVFHKGIYYCNIVSNRLVKLLSSPNSASATAINSESQLSEREMEIMRLICQQFSSKEIANKLNIPLRTVENCRERIQEKVGAKNMVGIATYAIKNRIYTFDE